MPGRPRPPAWLLVVVRVSGLLFLGGAGSGPSGGSERSIGYPAISASSTTKGMKRVGLTASKWPVRALRLANMGSESEGERNARLGTLEKPNEELPLPGLDAADERGDVPSRVEGRCVSVSKEERYMIADL